MTEIKVERESKGGIPWWVWALLALLLIAALLWWLLDDEDEVEAVREPVVAEAVVAPVAMEPAGDPAIAGNQMAGNQMSGNQMAGAGSTGPITDASMLYAGINDSMVGRSVQLTGVRVMEVVGDAGFWIGNSPQQRAFVLLDEERTPNTPVEGRVDVNQGQEITLSGTVRTKAEALRDLATGSNASLPQGVDHFLVADRVQVQS